MDLWTVGITTSGGTRNGLGDCGYNNFRSMVHPMDLGTVGITTSGGTRNGLWDCGYNFRWYTQWTWDCGYNFMWYTQNGDGSLKHIVVIIWYVHVYASLAETN